MAPDRTKERTFIPSAIVTTDCAAFHITITPFRNQDTRDVEHYTLNLRSQKSKCIQMNIPSIESGKKEGTLIWVEKVGPVCYLTSKDTKYLSQHAVDLAFTIARDINPTCTRYAFDDYSAFPCALPDGTYITLPMKQFHIAFHGSTWYEKWYGAKLVKDHDLYQRLKLNMYDSAKKPATFSFKHDHLDTLLQPLYEASPTWNDFFQAIQAKYGDKKCSVLYPWLLDAMFQIFDDEYIFEYPPWYIDFEENAKEVKTPHVSFRTYEDALVTGGRRQTRRKSRNETYNLPTLYVRNPFLIEKLDYLSFLESPRSK